MSETAEDDRRAVLARIDRDMAETRKLLSESLKLHAEQGKLNAEQANLTRDHYLAPWLAIAGLVGGVVTVITLLAHLLGRG